MDEDSFLEDQYEGYYEQDDLQAFSDQQAWEDEMADRYADDEMNDYDELD
jgi:hypothetical protein